MKKSGSRDVAGPGSTGSRLKPQQGSFVTARLFRVPLVGQAIAFCGLSQGACGPRDFMKKSGSRDVAGPGSTGSRLKPQQGSFVTARLFRVPLVGQAIAFCGLSQGACGPRDFMKKSGSRDVAGPGSTGSRLKPQQGSFVTARLFR